MTQKTNYFKLGLFVIIATALLAVFLIIFGAGDFFKKELLAETCFNESVQGLSIGSEVKYKGIKIGSVKSITSAARIYQTKSDYVLVIISLEESISLGQTGKTAKVRIQNAIQDGLTIKIAFKGLTGAAYLETDYTTIDTKELLKIAWSPRNIYIPSQQSKMKQFGDSINQILDSLAAINMKGMTLDIQSLLKTLNQKVNDVDMKNISGLVASLLTEIKDTNTKVSGALGSPRLKQLMDDAQVSFSEIRTIVEAAKTPLNQAIMDFQKAAGSTRTLTTGFETQLGPKIGSLATSLDKLMKSLSATSDLLENLVWLNSDKIKLIIENLETTSENLKQMSKDIKRYPGRLLFEKPPERSHSEKKTDEKK
ncbi:MAG: MlaD family protein [Pseudomonadota bacterium]